MRVEFTLTGESGGCTYRVQVQKFLSWKGHGNEADFPMFLHKSVRHRSFTLHVKPFRFWLRIRGDFRNRNKNWNGSKGSVRDSWGSCLCKNPRKFDSLPCPFNCTLTTHEITLSPTLPSHRGQRCYLYFPTLPLSFPPDHNRCTNKQDRKWCHIDNWRGWPEYGDPPVEEEGESYLNMVTRL